MSVLSILILLCLLDGIFIVVCATCYGNSFFTPLLSLGRRLSLYPTVFATIIARRLPSVFILVYLVIPPCSLKSVLGRLFILLGVPLYVGVSCMLHWAGVGLLST